VKEFKHKVMSKNKSAIYNVLEASSRGGFLYLVVHRKDNNDIILLKRKASTRMKTRMMYGLRVIGFTQYAKFKVKRYEL
jgi:hypothetical protein